MKVGDLVIIRDEPHDQMIVVEIWESTGHCSVIRSGRLQHIPLYFLEVVNESR